jgi:hypothetical protein
MEENKTLVKMNEDQMMTMISKLSSELILKNDESSDEGMLYPLTHP